MAVLRNPDEVSRIWTEIASRVVESVQDAQVASWSTIRLQVVSAADASAWSIKLRVTNGQGDADSVEESDILCDLIQKLIESKHLFFDPVWFGFTLRASVTGKCEIDFNYDPDCDNDDTFYED